MTVVRSGRSVINMMMDLESHDGGICPADGTGVPRGHPSEPLAAQMTASWQRRFPKAALKASEYHVHRGWLP